MRRHPIRLLLTVAGLLLAALPAAASAATYPKIASISPKKLGIGDLMTIKGTGFRAGKGKNTVVFKKDGGRAVFVKASRTATKTRIQVLVPVKLLTFLHQKSGKPVATRFRVRVLSTRFGKTFTSLSASPVIGPDPTGGLGTASTDCDGDGIPNTKDTDDDNDLLPDTTEAAIKTDPCKRDTDGDGMSDGWEYQSAIDRNGGSAKPAPSARPYPNPLYPNDANTDSDGDGLTNLEEYVAWALYGGNKIPLSYSGGNPASAGRGAVPPALAYMDRDGNGFLSDIERDADGDGIPNMDEGDLRIADRLVTGQDSSDPRFYDYGLFSTTYISDVSTATAGDPSKFLCTGINQVPFFCGTNDVQKVDALDWLSADTDGDGMRDDADDVDHDGVPNFTEYLTELTAAPADRHYGQINPCYPSTDATPCLIGTEDIDHDGLANRDDTDDDGDGLPDVVEKQYGTDPLRADTDNDGVDDGFEYQSAIDLNSSAVPYPGKKPYPNPLDGTDADKDFDQDSLTLKEEYKAWVYSGRPRPYNYSDGTKYTGGKIAAPTDPAHAYQDLDGNGFLSDDEKDVDNDGLTNWDETHGRMTQQWWVDMYDTDPFNESRYPGPDYLEPSFVDPDTDGDGIKDGADDQDHDGLTNAFEVARPANWATTYISTTHSGSNAYARVQPFNPCKPVYSDACHAHPPFGYYHEGEDWASPVHP